MYRHKTWATVRLIGYSQGLGGEHLDQDTDLQSREITSRDGRWRMPGAVPMAPAAAAD
jgi:hypothetical protein